MNDNCGSLKIFAKFINKPIVQSVKKYNVFISFHAKYIFLRKMEEG